MTTLAPLHRSASERRAEFAREHWIMANAAKVTEHRYRWTVALLAYNIVGKSKNGATKKLAERIGCKEDTVEQLSHAWHVFVFLREQDARRARKDRSRYTFTRFAAIWHTWRNYEPDPSQLFDLLEMDAGLRGMMAFAEDVFNPAPKWRRELPLLVSVGNRFLTNHYEGVPDSLRAKIEAVRDEARLLLDVEQAVDAGAEVGR